MKARTKSVWLLFGTLLVGLLLGTLGTSALQNRRAEQIRKTRERGGITRILERVVATQDDAQRAQIREILANAEERALHARTECGHMFAAQRDSLRADLEAVLTPEQQQRLDAWFQKNQRRKSKRGSRRDRHR